MNTILILTAAFFLEGILWYYQDTRVKNKYKAISEEVKKIEKDSRSISGYVDALVFENYDKEKSMRKLLRILKQYESVLQENGIDIPKDDQI